MTLRIMVVMIVFGSEEKKISFIRGLEKKRGFGYDKCISKLKNQITSELSRYYPIVHLKMILKSNQQQNENDKEIQDKISVVALKVSKITIY